MHALTVVRASAMAARAHLLCGFHLMPLAIPVGGERRIAPDTLFNTITGRDLAEAYDRRECGPAALW